jgi:hypothetical protein
MIRATFLAALLVLFSVPKLEASVIGGTVVWSDGFESGNFSAWSGSSGNWSVVTSTLSAQSGLRGADVKGNTDPDPDILSVAVSSVGTQNLEWSYWYKVRESLDADDSVAVEWTANGADWQALASYSAAEIGDWQFASFDLPAAADNNPNLGFRLRATLSSATDRMNFDNFTLTTTAVPEPAAALSLVSAVGLVLRRRRRLSA